LIKPDGWEIPKEKFWIENGFSTEVSALEGVDISSVIIPFVNDVEKVDFIVSHNMAFDHPILGAEMIRLGLRSSKKPEKICTKEASTEYCKIPHAWDKEKRPWMMGKKGYKWPKLSELHVKLFGTEFDGAHDAMSDVNALAKCFFELTKRGVIKLETIIPANDDSKSL
jgi:DNA polymerase III epsilon subunit-like protein